jgi:hypothetical protein
MKTTLRQREAAAFKAPVTEERERLENLSQTPNLPGIEDNEPPRVRPKSDGIWPLAEKLLEFALQQGGYTVQSQTRLGLVCSLPNEQEKIVVSCKWLRKSGSFDEKISDEVKKLHELIPCDARDGVVRAYVVIVGPGLKKEKRLRWTEGEIDTPHVKVVDIDFFLAAVYCQKL